MNTSTASQNKSPGGKRRRSSRNGWLRTRPVQRSSSSNRRNLRIWANQVREFEQEAASLTSKQIAEKVLALKEEPETSARADHQFAGLIAEAVFRTNGFRLHDVQVQAMAAGAMGTIVEMQTGEGKTVVTGAIAAIKSRCIDSVHVGTTNTYLAARDLESMQDTFDLLGISAGLLPEENNEIASRRAYRKQIVYGPGYQYGFDYLRDQLYLRTNRQTDLGTEIVNRIRGNNAYENLIQPSQHHAALIDEADSVMIDEAMTPLIISLPSKNYEDPKPYLLARKIVAEFERDVDYTIELPAKKIDVKDQANTRAHELVAKHRRLQLTRPWRLYISNAIRARDILERDIDYVVLDDKVQIVDQYTGRILADRTWQDGLHQAVEAKENLSIQPGRESTTQVTRQRYMQMYTSLGGLTGTASSVAEEFTSVYKCPVIEIPTNKKCMRKRERTRFFSSQEAKLEAIAADVIQRHQTGQPILVGTKTIHESYQVRDILQSRGLEPTVLNGVQDEDEADIVAKAGSFGALTIATNMAGRGTDIKPDENALEAGGLHVIGVSPNASKRIDRQLAGRAARQGQPGSVQFFAAATDSIFADNKSPLAKQIARRAKKSGESANYSRDLSALQESIEARNFKQRKDMILRDRWMDKVREAIEKE